MKLKSNIIIVFCSLILFLMFLVPKQVVYASFHTEAGDGFTVTMADNTTDTTAGDFDENGIKQLAEGDKYKFTFKNLETLNIRIDELWSFVRWGLSFLCAFGAISSFFILTKSFLQLAWLPDHPAQRRKVYVDILTSGVCTILFGGLALIMTVFYKSFEELIMSSALYNRDFKSSFALFLVEYKYMIAGADAILTLTLVVLLIKDIIELAASGGNPRKREESIKSIMFTIIGIIGAGGVGLLVGIFTGLLV